MRITGSAARILGMPLLLAASCWLVSGCGNGGDAPILETIDAADFQEPQNDQPKPAEAKPVADTVATEQTTDKTTEEAADSPPAETPAAETPETVVDSDLKPVDPNATETPEDKQPREVKVLIPERTFQPEGPDKALRITYDDINLLKVLNMDPVTADADKLMPKWLKDLDGQRIRLRGFMYPSFMDTGLTGFVVVRDIQECCFGPNPKPYDLIQVLMRKGETTDYLQSRPFDVEGVLHIEIIQFEGEDKVSGVYWIDDALVLQR